MRLLKFNELSHSETPREWVQVTYAFKSRIEVNNWSFANFFGMPIYIQAAAYVIYIFHYHLYRLRLLMTNFNFDTKST